MRYKHLKRKFYITLNIILMVNKMYNKRYFKTIKKDKIK